jgi:hypothetical protein
MVPPLAVYATYFFSLLYLISPCVSPMHDPRGWHVMHHHMTDSLGHLPVLDCSLWCHLTSLLYDIYGLLRVCRCVSDASWHSLELDPTYLSLWQDIQSSFGTIIVHTCLLGHLLIYLLLDPLRNRLRCLGVSGMDLCGYFRKLYKL